MSFQKVFLVLAVCAPFLAACNSDHEKYGFASRVEMDLANRNGFLTKARVDASMTPLAVPVYSIPEPRLDMRVPHGPKSRDLLALCGAPYSCSMAMTAAAREADTASIRSGVSRILALSQISRGGGGYTADMTDLELAKRISALSRTNKSAAFGAITDGLQVDPRRSGLWLGMAVYQGLHGSSDDAWAAAWLSWHFAEDKAQAVQSIKDMFYAESNAAVKPLYGRALRRIRAIQAQQVGGIR